MLTSRPTHGGGAPLGIDLEAGVARITVPRPAAPVAEEPDEHPPVAGAEQGGPVESGRPSDTDQQPAD